MSAGAGHAVAPSTLRTCRPSLVPALMAALVAGCAPAMPSLSGAHTTPDGRAEVALGTAVRVPFAEVAPPALPGGVDEVLALASPGGAVPVELGRVGFAGDWDLSVVAAGSGGRIELRGDRRLSPMAHFHAGVAVSGGYAGAQATQGTTGGEGYRIGAFVPLTLGVDVSGIFEAWATARLGAERIEGTIGLGGTPRASEAWMLRAGLALGLAVGFRRFHVLVEVAVDAEHVRGTSGGTAFERTGGAVTPAVGLRVRF